MILSNVGIQQALDDGDVVIQPEPLPRRPTAAQASCPYDTCLVHFTAPTIHSGFEGTIALEMINLAEYPISLFPEMEICQLIIENVEPMPFANPSEFQKQSTPTGR